MLRKLVLSLPRFVLRPITASAIAALHVYLAAGHLCCAGRGPSCVDTLWKGFDASLGAHVFAALASRTKYNLGTIRGR